MDFTAMQEETESFLRKQAWDYFSIHASQRIAVFNFYVVLSSLILTSYFASFKSDSNLQPARPVLALLLCLFAFIFWRLDDRNKLFIKNSERALKYFENKEPADEVVKVFTQEEKDTKAKRLTGWRRIMFWRVHLSYSKCFNILFLVFLLVGLAGFISSLCHCGLDKLQQTQTQSLGHYQYQENVNKRP